jgi:hypothetical protein
MPPEIGREHAARAGAILISLAMSRACRGRAQHRQVVGCAAAVNTRRCYYRVAAASCPPILPSNGIAGSMPWRCTHLRIWSIRGGEKKFAFSGEHERLGVRRRAASLERGNWGIGTQLGRGRTLSFCNYRAFSIGASRVNVPAQRLLCTLTALGTCAGQPANGTPRRVEGMHTRKRGAAATMPEN